MFRPGWLTWCVFLTLHMSTCGLKTSGYDNHEVICSQGLSECTVKDEILLKATNNTVGLQDLKPHFKLCCKDRTKCTLCLVIDTELYIQPDKKTEDDGRSGSDEEDNTEERRNPKACVTVCYSTASTLPTCKKVEFTVTHAALTHHYQGKMSIVITEPDGFPFSIQVHVYPANEMQRMRTVVAPSLNEVCSQELQKRVPQCQVSHTVSTVINQEMNQVELHFDGSNKTLPYVCIQYEKNGGCRIWSRTTIPLYSVAPCMCLKVWDKDAAISVHSRYCPFNKTDFLHVLQKNLWDNVSVSVRHGFMINYGTVLSWNVSAPCRLEGEVFLCHNEENNCRGINTFRQQLANGTWRQNSKGRWEKTGVFENIPPERPPCVMVKVKGMGHELGPYCLGETGRWRWSLLVVGGMLLVCLTVLMFYLLHDFVKKWVWSWHHGGFVKVGRKGHVLLLSPPALDDGVSESVCRLGSFLCNQGFSVSVDQWSRKEQCALGPLPWLYSQLQTLNRLGGQVLLVLTRRALQKAEEWARWNTDVMKMGENGDLPKSWSPYSDVFTASLFRIQGNKQLGSTGERFLLVEFDSHPTQSHGNSRNLPELLQGLPLFQLPSQTESLLTELTVVDAERGLGGRTQTGWKAYLR